jgi:hypothetical protein
MKQKVRRRNTDVPVQREIDHLVNGTIFWDAVRKDFLNDVDRR